MTQRWIKALQRDKEALSEKVSILQSSIDGLSPENARLREALGNARANGTLSAILTSGGGAAVGVAGFAGDSSGYVATAGGVAMVIGLALLIMSGVRLTNVIRTTVEK